MKRLLAFLTMLLLLIPMICYAEIDFASMTTEELVGVINRAKNELEKRMVVVEKDAVLIDYDGFTMYLTGEYRVKPNYLTLQYDAVIINNTDVEILTSVHNATINGWQVETYRPEIVIPGAKCKTGFSFKLEDANITTYEEIEELTFTLEISEYGNGVHKTIFITEPIVLISK